MDQELETIIKERYKLLPDNIKQVLASLPIGELVQEIAKQNNLLLDKSGDLYTETILVLLGVEKATDFSRNIQKHLVVSDNLASNLAKAVNEKIFLSVRESLQKINEVLEKTENEVPKTTEREQILDEIENPKKSESSPSSPLVQGDIHPMVEDEESYSLSLINQKLTQSTSNPIKQVSLKETPPPVQTSKTEKKYSVDPYRETI